MPQDLNQTPDGAEQSAPDRPCEVGRKPPLDGKFKPGHPSLGGRPKGQRNVATVLRKGLSERTKIREGQRIRSVTKLDAIILRVINDAALGNAKAPANLIALMRAAGLLRASDEPAQQERTATDQAVTAEAETAKVGSSPYALTEEFLSRLSVEALDEITRVGQELAAEKTK